MDEKGTSERPRVDYSDNWWEKDKWREKGPPSEQIDFNVNGEVITLYNFNKDRKLTEKQLLEAQDTFHKYAAAFPDAVRDIKYVLLDDIQPDSTWGDEEKFPQNGYSDTKNGAISISPRVLENAPHRINTLSNWQGTLAHEIGHFCGNGGVYSEWTYTRGFKKVVSPNGKKIWFKDPHSGLTYPGFYDYKEENFPIAIQPIPLHPEEFVTDYAKVSRGDDTSESLVAFFYDLDLLKRVSPEKYKGIDEVVKKDQKVEVTFKIVPSAQIRLPQAA